MLKQKESVQKYTTEFERYTMQLTNLPLTIEMHYYLKGLKVEIRQLVESNELNLMDMITLKNACLRQDHITSPPPGSDRKTSKCNEESIALTASSFRGRYNTRGRNTRGSTRGRRGGYNNTHQRGGYTQVKSENIDSKEYNQWKPRYIQYKVNNSTSTQCYACSEYGHPIRECPAVKDAIDKH